MNSFLALRDYDLTAFTPERRVRVQREVERDLRTAELIASIVQLFGPVMADTLNVMGGGDSLMNKADYLTIRETEDDDPFGAAPGGPSEIIR